MTSSRFTSKEHGNKKYIKFAVLVFFQFIVCSQKCSLFCTTVVSNLNTENCINPTCKQFREYSRRMYFHIAVINLTAQYSRVETQTVREMEEQRFVLTFVVNNGYQICCLSVHETIAYSITDVCVSVLTFSFMWYHLLQLLYVVPNNNCFMYFNLCFPLYFVSSVSYVLPPLKIIVYLKICL